ncbi:MAG: tetratricopeptide repeat protein [Terriglobales bacterium]
MKILYSNSRSMKLHARVDLLNGTGLLIKQAFTDDTGNVLFPQLAPGNYKIRVSDPTIEDNMTDTFSIASGEASFQLVTVTLKGEAEVNERASGAVIAASEINVPSKAQKEYQFGAEALMRHDWETAQQHLEKAVELYPQYGAAYNDLGVVFMNTGARAKGRASFEKAIEVDGRKAAAYVNLAKINYAEGKWEVVKELLKKALPVDPANPEALTILAQVQLITGDLDEALANARKVHSLPHEHLAVAHWVAAKALVAQRRPDEAIVEYIVFLRESPNGPSAEAARTALAELQKQNH